MNINKTADTSLVRNFSENDRRIQIVEILGDKLQNIDIEKNDQNTAKDKSIEKPGYMTEINREQFLLTKDFQNEKTTNDINFISKRQSNCFISSANNKTLDRISREISINNDQTEKSAVKFQGRKQSIQPITAYMSKKIKNRRTLSHFFFDENKVKMFKQTL